MRVGFPLGIALIIIGYAFLYSGYTNITTAGHGVGVIESLTGDPSMTNGEILIHLSDRPNLSGNVPQTGTPQGPTFI